MAERYVEHLKTETLPSLSGIPGFIRASILQRDVPSGTEFQIVTEWESMEAVAAFAGDRPEAAVVPAIAQAMMVDYDQTVVHYEVTDRFPAN
jgi:heme-degrading monooxygenase HmoA